MTGEAEDRVIATCANPARRQSFDANATSLTVLMVPGTFAERKPFGIVRPALVQDEHLMAAFDWSPAGEPGSASELRERFVVFAAIRHKDLERVESRYPALPKFEVAKLRELVFHVSQNGYRSFLARPNSCLLALTGKSQQFVVELRAEEE